MPDDAKKSKPADGDDVKVSAGGWSDAPRPRRKAFPGPASANGEPLRIAMTRDAYADLTAHAKESLNAEICGVLVGDFCEDDAGPFITVDATIRGTAAKQGSTHVTFTQDTWNQIHAEKDKKHAKRQIVGWYHTHPGFGVEFSEMDRFIQRNFFPGASQIAFVTDPLGGQEAILANAGGAGAEAVPVGRFWVEGRERKCEVPRTEASGDGGGAAGATSPETAKAIQAIEERIGQLMQMVDASTASMHRALLFMGMVIATIVIFFVAYQIWAGWTNDNKPPQLQGFAPVPVQIGDKTVLLGVGVVNWEVPKSLNAAMIAVERERQEAEAKKKGGATTAPSTTAPSTTAPAAATQPAKK